jgi:hypothetical protein
MSEILREVNGRHPALAEPALDHVAVGKCKVKELGAIGHDDL